MKWQLIKTAPRGEEFIAYDPVARKMDVCHMVPFITGVQCDAVQYDGEYDPEVDDFQGRRATHWMPLPVPPA